MNGRKAEWSPGKSRQEEVWAGAFGDAYVDRNRRLDQLAGKRRLFARILARAPGVQSVLELGANIGLNLIAIGELLPHARLAGVEINGKAHAELARIPRVEAHLASLFDFTPETPFDLAFTAGVLIHVAPERLPEAYDRLHAASRRYLLVVEYYNPTPLEVPYRGERGLLFKRDFAGELMDRFADLALVDYGFVWRRDPVFPLDDLTWFLLEKRGGTGP